MASITRRKSSKPEQKIAELQQKIAELKKEIRVLRRDKKRLEQEMTAEQEGKDSKGGFNHETGSM